MRGQDLDTRLVELAINYTKSALNEVYPEKGIFDLDKLESKPPYATSDSTVRLIFLGGRLELDQGETKLFKSNVQFLLSERAVKPHLLELKIDFSKSALQFHFREERDGERMVYRMWGSNYINEGVKQSKTG